MEECVQQLRASCLPAAKTPKRENWAKTGKQNLERIACNRVVLCGSIPTGGYKSYLALTWLGTMAFSKAGEDHFVLTQPSLSYR